MRLIEAEAKKILQRRGLAVPAQALLLHANEPVPAIDGPVAVKAQILQGNRAAAGLVELVPADQAASAVARIGAAMIKAGHEPIVLIEQQLSFVAAYYVGWRIDDLNQKPMLLFSSQGGAGIESRVGAVGSYLHPVLQELLPHHLVGFLRDNGVPPGHLGAVARYCVALYEIFRIEDAVLLEINPLVINPRGHAVALDAKMIVDDNARPRHNEWRGCISERVEAHCATPLEAAAARAGFTFVELPGRIAVFSAGAGLGMCLLDVLTDAGMPPANFSDATGGAGPEKWAEMAKVAFKRAASPEVDAILVYFTLTATSLKSVITGLFWALDASPQTKPMVVCMICAAAAEQEMTVAEMREMLRARGHECVTSMPDAIKALQDVLAAPV